MKRMKSYLTTTLKILFAAAIIYWLVTTGKVDFQVLYKLLDPKIAIVAFILMGVNFWFTVERWFLLLRSQAVTCTRMQAWKLGTIGVFFNFVVPGGVGGDVIKGYYIAKGNPQQRMKAVVTVAMDRLVGLYTMLLMAVSVMLWDWQAVAAHRELKAIFFFLLAVTAAFSVFWMMIFSRRLSSAEWIHSLLHFLPKGEHLWKMFSSFSSYALSKKIIFQTVALSFAAQIFVILLFIHLGHALGFDHVSAGTYFFVVPIGFMVTAIPIAPAGIGIGQAAFYYLFNLASGVESSIGATTITAMQLIQFAFGLLGAWYYVAEAHAWKVQSGELQHSRNHE